jgi:hypothetical protein
MTPTLPLSLPKGATVQGGISQFESKSRTDTTVELIESVSTNIARLRGCRARRPLLILDSPRLAVRSVGEGLCYRESLR